MISCNVDVSTLVVHHPSFQETAYLDLTDPTASCSGTAYLEWASLNTCIPSDQDSSSTWYSHNSTHEIMETTYNTTRDCKGMNTVDIHMRSSESITYAAQATTWSGYASVYFYLDTTGCSDTIPYLATAYASGKCVAGLMASCSNGDLALSSYPYPDCTGTPTVSSIPAGICLQGIKVDCSMTFKISADSEVLELFSSLNCDSSKRNGGFVYKVGVCAPFPPASTPTSMQMVTYNASLNQFTTSVYAVSDTNCTGTPTSWSNLPLASVSFDIDAAASLSFNQLLFALLITLTLVSNLF